MGQVLKLLGTEAGPALAPVLNNLETYEAAAAESREREWCCGEEQHGQAADTIQGAWKRVQTAVQNIFADQSLLGDLIKGVLQTIAVTIEGIGMALQVLMVPLNALKTFFTELSDAVLGIEGTERIITGAANAWKNLQLAVRELTEWTTAWATAIAEEIAPGLQEASDGIQEALGY